MSVLARGVDRLVPAARLAARSQNTDGLRILLGQPFGADGGGAAGRNDDVLIDARQLRDLRTSSDNALLEAYSFTVVELQSIGRGERGIAVHNSHLALLSKLRKPTDEFADYVVLPATQCIGIDFRFAEHDAVVGHCFSIVDYFRGMQ